MGSLGGGRTTEGESQDLDYDVLNTIMQMGYSKQTIIEKLEAEEPNFCNLYNKIKAEKRSASATRFSQARGKQHQAAVFPNFVPSIGSSDNKSKLKLPSTSGLANLPSGHHPVDGYSVGSYGLGEINSSGQQQF